jgi:hypothetical protein
MSHRGPAQVRRLVDRLRIDGGRDLVTVVHHDPAGEPLDMTSDDGLLVMPEPQRCRWGQYDKLVGIWRCLNYAATAVPGHSWILLVSGQDYPAMPVRAMVEELQASPHDAYLRHLQLDGDPANDVHHWQPVARRRYLHRRRAPFYHRSIPWLPRHPFRGTPGLHAYGGDDWFTLSATAVRRALDASDLADRLLRFCRTAPNPSELFMPSLIANLPRLDIVNDRRRWIRFDHGAPHPHVVTPDDVPEVLASGAFFARKFDMERQPKALDLVDAAIASDRARRSVGRRRFAG